MHGENGGIVQPENKRLNMGRTKITFNMINFVEGGKRHLHVLSGIIKMCRVRFEFSVEEMGKGRRRFDIIHAFVKGNVLGSLDLASLKIFIVCMLHRLLVSQEDSRMSMHINLGISRFGGKGIDATAEFVKEREIGPATGAQALMQCDYHVEGN